MSQYPGMDGTNVFISDGGIRRFKPIDFDDLKRGTKIDHAVGYLLTPLPLDEVFERLDDPSIFVAFIVRSGVNVFINSNSVLSVRPSIPTNGPGTEINVGGLYQHVSEDYDDVMQKLGLS